MSAQLLNSLNCHEGAMLSTIMLGKTEKSSDVCRTASVSEIGHKQRAATSSTVTDQRRKTSLSSL